METDSLQTLQNFPQTIKRRKLILEARHSISIEASNKIRSNLSPRLFIPRQPISRYATKPQYNSKALKLKFYRNQNSINIQANTEYNKELKSQKKCQTQISENLLKGLRGKYTKRTKMDQKQSSHKMENEVEHNKLKCSKKKLNKQDEKKKRKFGHSKKERKMKLKTKTKSILSKELNFQEKSKVEGSRSWGNSKVIAKENPTDNVKYLTDGEIIFIDDPLNLDTQKGFNEVKNRNRVLGNFTNATSEKTASMGEKSEQLVVSHSFQNSQIMVVPKSKNLKTDETFNDLQYLAHKFTENSRNSPKFINKISEILDQNTTSNSSCNSLPLPTEFREQNEPPTAYNSKQISNQIIYNLENKNFPNTSEQISSKTKDTQAKTKQCNTPTSSYEETTQNSYNQQLKESNSYRSYSKESNHLPSTSKSLRNHKQFLTEEDLMTLTRESLYNMPLENFIYTASAVVSDFQDAVKSSISQIYDCSNTDQNINQDLHNLENCVETFSKFLLQTYSKLEQMDWETSKSMDYLHHKVMRNPQERSSLASYIPKQAPETLTIIIEAYKMPPKTITFKMTDILKPTFTSDNDQNSKELLSKANQIQMPNTNLNHKRKILDVEIISNVKLPNFDFKEKQEAVVLDIRNSINHKTAKTIDVTDKIENSHVKEYQDSIPKCIRRKITPKKSHQNCIIQNQLQRINNENERRSPQEINHKLAAKSPNPLRLHRFYKHHKSKENQTITKSTSTQILTRYPNYFSSSHNPQLPNHKIYKPHAQYPNCHFHEASAQLPMETSYNVSNYSNTNLNRTNYNNFNQIHTLYQSTRKSLEYQGFTEYHNLDYQNYPWHRYYQNSYSNNFYPTTYNSNDHSNTYNSIFVDYISNNCGRSNYSEIGNPISYSNQNTFTEGEFQRPND